MQYSLNEAAAAVGKGRMTIQRAIKRGVISAAKDERGHYRIGPAELHRVFPPASHETFRDPSQGRAVGCGDTAREIEKIRAELDQKAHLLDLFEGERRREREQLEATIEDLRQRLDGEASERKRLTHLLTDQRSEAKGKSGWTWWPRPASA